MKLKRGLPLGSCRMETSRWEWPLPCHQLSTSCLVTTPVILCPEWWGEDGEGVKVSKCKGYWFCRVFAGGRVVGEKKKRSIHHSGWLKVSCIFKATIFLSRIAGETNISRGKVRKEKEERVQWDFFFHFRFYIKVLRPQWKKFFFFPYI